MTSTMIPVATEIKSISYTAPSATTEGVSYTVTVDGRGWHCTCTASEFNRHCWHVRAAKAGVLGRPVVRMHWTAPVPSEHEAAITAAQMSRAAYLARAAATVPALSDLYG
jgi:hypothetical protein